ncbi:MAG TPA: hypothetical protein RMH99_03705 [Sandaracinaceae bacterium LLY-WYZ-13_1]|nr:hypothetical protein [Sandaracinaceae bacterium LLY-WYZ-13_1]
MRARLLVLSLLVLAPRPAAAQLAEICHNRHDDDGDGRVDCADADCAGHPACPAAAQAREDTPALCRNGRDDDGDGDVDCEDARCRSLVACPDPASTDEETGARCGNGRDDDGDTYVDCDDPSCAEACTRAGPRDGQPGTRGIYRPRTEMDEAPAMGFEAHDDPRRYPMRFVRRPVTYLRGMLVPRLGLSVRASRRFGADPLETHLGPALSYGVFDFWQVTFVALPMRLSPIFEVENLALSSTLRLLDHEVVELGLYANVAFPVGTAEDVGPAEPLPHHHLLARSRASDVTQLDLALAVRLHLGDWVRVDLALPVSTFVFAEDAASGDPDVRVDLVFDARVAVQVGEYGYLGVFGGVFVPGPDYEAPKVPFGFFVGGSVPGHDRGPVADLGFRFGWPIFFDSAPGTGAAAVDPAFWQLTFDARVFAYLLP